MRTGLGRRTSRVGGEKHLLARYYVSDCYKLPKPLVAGVSAFPDWSLPLADKGGFQPRWAENSLRRHYTLRARGWPTC
jgi:hypothetical protein